METEVPVCPYDCLSVSVSSLFNSWYFLRLLLLTPKAGS